ncbi:hypothetical protein LTR62_006504 [Meristemomyces frigidus]|uniref:Uncharacterized protein n=1 Tax=Meristemomyces frigidus TaxID=1508187 RepID=A0AAN7TDY1_9PEZI|nr:hypothetical protein LTR62_006504 [Meristemomyces frigidus]
MGDHTSADKPEASDEKPFADRAQQSEQHPPRQPGHPSEQLLTQQQQGEHGQTARTADQIKDEKARAKRARKAEKRAKRKKAKKGAEQWRREIGDEVGLPRRASQPGQTNPRRDDDTSHRQPPQSDPTIALPPPAPPDRDPRTRLAPLPQSTLSDRNKHVQDWIRDQADEVASGPYKYDGGEGSSSDRFPTTRSLSDIEASLHDIPSSTQGTDVQHKEHISCFEDSEQKSLFGEVLQSILSDWQAPSEPAGHGNNPFDGGW